MNKTIKRGGAALLALLLCLAMGGCGRKTEGGDSASGSSAASSVAEAPLTVDTLRLELTAGDGAEAMLRAVETLKTALPAALEKAGITAGSVRVSVAASGSAAAEALQSGSVDAAVMNAGDYIRFAGEGTVILGERMEEDASWGRSALLCTTPSPYGRALADRAAETEALGWSEIEHAVWGVLEVDSLYGRRLAELWLADHYGGSTTADLTRVEVFSDYESLLRAAAEERVDIIAVPEDVLAAYESRWQMETTRTGEDGGRGFGRDGAMDGELIPFAETERGVERVIVLSADMAAAPGLADALTEAFVVLGSDENGRDGLAAAGGSGLYAPLADKDLDPMRRLLSLEGETW